MFLSFENKCIISSMQKQESEGYLTLNKNDVPQSISRSKSNRLNNRLKIKINIFW